MRQCSIRASPISLIPSCVQRSGGSAERLLQLASDPIGLALLGPDGGSVQHIRVRLSMILKIWFVVICTAVAILLSPVPSPAADPGAGPTDVQNLLKVNRDDRILGNP